MKTSLRQYQNEIRFFLNFSLFLCIAIFNTQLLPFLKSIGYDTMQRGIILAINAFFSILFQMLFGFLCDQFQNMKRFFYLAYALFLGFGILMFWWSKQMFFFHLVTTSMMASMVKVLSALLETWMLYLDEKKYGKYRSMGALGLCFGSPLAGIIIASFSYYGLVIAAMVISCITLLCAFLSDEVSYQEKIDVKMMISLFHNKEYLYFVFIYFTIYMVGTADQYAVIDKMMNLNAGSILIGIKWAIQSLLEIPFFLYADQLLRKYSPYLLLGIGIAMYGIKFVFYGISPSPFWIIITTILQIVTLPVVAYTSKVIFALITPKLKASSQMLAMAFFIGGSAFVTPLITSFMAQYFDYDTILYGWATFSLFPLILLLLKKNRIKQ